jgi:two-component system, cell cycle sensor histidine kinase and response regulator CckA
MHNGDPMNAPEGQAPPNGRPTILIVDDEETMRDLLTRILIRAGYAAVAETDGDKGLQRFREGGIDVVITDMMMPAMNGLELIEALTQESPEVRVVAVSGIDSRTRFLKRALELGAKATLLKPVGRDDLVKTVERILG